MAVAPPGPSKVAFAPVREDIHPIVVNVTLAQPARGWTSPEIYAPAVPGVLVALAGLLIAHRLTQARERRKEVHELCIALKKSAADANEAIVKAWLAGVGASRLLDVEDAKRRIQSLGIAATDLKSRTGRLRFPYWRRSELDVTAEVSRLRTAATRDPFEDPERAADPSQLREVSQAVGELSIRIDRRFADLFG